MKMLEKLVVNKKQSKTSPSAFFYLLYGHIIIKDNTIKQQKPKQQTIHLFHIFVFVFTIQLLTQFGT